MIKKSVGERQNGERCIERQMSEREKVDGERETNLREREDRWGEIKLLRLAREREREGSFERAGFETESLRVTSLNKKFERHREKFETTRIEQNV